MKKKGQQGQMLLIVILVMVVVLTVGLGVAARSVTNIKISKQNEESQRAFQAAEAGLELAKKSIKRGFTSSGVAGSPSYTFNFNSNNSQIQTNLIPVTFDTNLLNNGKFIDQDVGIDVWLTKYPRFSDPNVTLDTDCLDVGSPNPQCDVYNGSIDFYYSANQTCSGSGDTLAPALEVFVISGNKTTPIIQKFLHDECNRIQGSNRGNPANDSVATDIISRTGVNFLRKAGVSGINSGIVLKVIPLYNSTQIAIRFTPDNSPSRYVPIQGTLIESSGTSGETVRKLQYYDPFPQVPIEMFQYALMSQGYATQ